MRITILAVALAATACGAKDDKTADDASAPDLVGTWADACGTDDATASPPDYDITTEVFTATTITASTTSFSDAKCTTKTSSSRAVGTYTIGASVATPAGARAIDITPTALYLTPMSDAEVAYYNGTASGSSKVCGGGWVVNQEKMLTKDLCADSPAFAKIFGVNYGVFKLEGTTLSGGKSGEDGSATDETTAAKRPTSYDPRIFTKK